MRDGGRPLVDGRHPHIPRYKKGNFIRPTLLEGLPYSSEIIRTGIFGPVLSMHQSIRSTKRSRL
jgi:malonate-semialdehyde dehydrogenase (acetylating)/methylmalonate-semialdehyde dehydrogenase